jgi:N-acetyltransferase 10
VAGGRALQEISLTEPIRYAVQDPVEAWLHQLLCLNVGDVPKGVNALPQSGDCNL